MTKGIILYALTLAAFGAGICFLVELGSQLPPGKATAEKRDHLTGTGPSPPEGNDSFLDTIGKRFHEHLREPLSILVLQVIVIVAVATLVGGLFRRMGQPAVIGEMAAGILLGPSLLGLVAPGTETFLFPPESLRGLRVVSQIGVILFMFVVGMDLDVRLFRKRGHIAVVVSHVSIIAPFFLGTVLALFLYPELATADVSFTAFGLFIGIALSITAFPVLARIIEDKELGGTILGTTATACAAVGDVTAWCILAAVIAIVSASGFGPALVTIALSLLFIAIMLLVIKPLAERISGREIGRRRNKGFLAGVLVFVFGSALATKAIGIQTFFGAFLAGVVMPPDSRLRSILKDRVETFSSVFLLPLFFAFTGLRTELGLLDDFLSWLMCADVILVAIIGKLGGSMLAAHWTGMSWRNSFALGALLNTRGLMELIVLNLGYDLGILSARVFTMLVLMALVTTFLTGPLLLVLRTNEEPAQLALAASYDGGPAPRQGH
jgi:Kef-type K+ transport system membrane component KefB